MLRLASPLLTPPWSPLPATVFTAVMSPPPAAGGCQVPLPDASEVRAWPDGAPVGSRKPVMRAVPFTSSAALGALVLMPTPPVDRTRNWFGPVEVKDPPLESDQTNVPRSPFAVPDCV